MNYSTQIFDQWQLCFSDGISEKTSKTWLRDIPAKIAANECQPIYRLRNQLYRMELKARKERSICIKSFARPKWLRSLHYSMVGSKAARSFKHAFHLAERGVGVPKPLGYFERWSGRQLSDSYFLSEFIEDATDLYAEMNRMLREDPDCHRYLALLRLVAAEVRRMHDCGFQHNDLGGQNILLRRIANGHWDRVQFIDLNRGRIHSELSLRQRAQDLANLEIPSFLRKIFFHNYFNDEVVPAEFNRWERLFRARRTLHNESRKYRHPIRTWVHSKKFVGLPDGSPNYKDTWLWDERSGQPSVVLESKCRHKYRSRLDICRIIADSLPQLPGIRRQYIRVRESAYQKPVDMKNRIGMSLEINTPQLEERLRFLESLPGISVFLRVYHHLGSSHLKIAVSAAQRLKSKGHEVSIGLIQCRNSVLRPESWEQFTEEALQALHPYITHVEFGHALNRVKWGLWKLDEVAALWNGVPQLRKRYLQLVFLGPPVNDFEYHYYPPLMKRVQQEVDAISCHLYVDRCGPPEGFQGSFSLLEKCVLGKAIADHYQTRGFYITETNWPRENAGSYSPITCGYVFPNSKESPLHVDDETYAAYMIRYYLISLCSGSVERVWWWRLASRGFGLCNERDKDFSTPACQAFRLLAELLANSTFRSHTTSGTLSRFDFDSCSVAYSMQPDWMAVPSQVTRVLHLDGQVNDTHSGQRIAVGKMPVFLLKACQSLPDSVVSDDRRKLVNE
ncbi:MAG: hypothetical protein JJU20_03805 [Opitutales bacterium]|nr:hypothetical protein [Opitutales bacterium]